MSKYKIGVTLDEQLDTVDGVADVDSIGYQRGNCRCYSGKAELLRQRHPCRHNCLYCNWKGGDER